MFVFCLIGIGVIAYIQEDKVDSEASQSLKSGMGVAWAILILLTLFWAGRIVWNYFIGQQIYVSKVIPKRNHHATVSQINK